MKQTAVAHTSTIITFILLIGMIIYHFSLIIKKKATDSEDHEDLLEPIEANSEVTYSIIELPKPNDNTKITQETVNAESESIYNVDL